MPCRGPSPPPAAAVASAIPAVDRCCPPLPAAPCRCCPPLPAAPAAACPPLPAAPAAAVCRGPPPLGAASLTHFVGSFTSTCSLNIDVSTG
ncbi:hypothetical protein HanRHA438_Chr04g0168091 [Helianthus annuus]|nr:hypothetical protein HanRHA438_Chr04g0168091 [Helianthus annuus]